MSTRVRHESGKKGESGAKSDGFCGSVAERKAMRRIALVAGELRKARRTTATWEYQLSIEVSELVQGYRGGLRDWARKIGISAQYACDIQHRRRKISEAVVDRILEATDAR